MKTSFNRRKENLRRKTLLQNWDFPMSEKVLIRLISILCVEVNSSFSLRVEVLLRYRRFDDLLDLSLDPSVYLDEILYLKDAQVLAMIKKYPLWTSNHDPKLNAMKKFIAAENQCRDTNVQIFGGSLHNEPELSAIIHGATRIISKILGRCPSLNDIPFKFGPGANYSVKKNTTAYDKLRSSLDVTDNAQDVASKFLATCPGWTSLHLSRNRSVDPTTIKTCLTVVPGDRLSFVPKNAKTLRPIGIGPLVNTVIQKGIGACIRARLKPVLDLKKLQISHRSYAHAASKGNLVSTIDLESASDTISYSIILALLPPDWFELLESVRSPSYTIEGKTYDFHKFSSMGNGYTFELESLIFYALSESCRRFLNVEGRVSVYGDDIIAPSACYDLIVKTLASCGFTTNNEKSFRFGNFKESCGGDYFNGTDVRPFYLKSALTIRTLVLCHNFLARNYTIYLLPKFCKEIRRLIGRENVSLMRGEFLEGDGYLFDATSGKLPKFVIEKAVIKRNLPRQSRFDIHKAFGLYRQMFAGYDDTVLDAFSLPHEIDFYMGVTKLTNIGPSRTFEKDRFKVRSTRNLKPFYIG